MVLCIQGQRGTAANDPGTPPVMELEVSLCPCPEGSKSRHFFLIPLMTHITESLVFKGQPSSYLIYVGCVQGMT